jgi:hypothetical protein
VYYGPDQPPQPATTITLYGEDKRQLAEDIAKWLDVPAAEIQTVQKTDETQPDVVIVIGRNFKIPGG